MNRAISKLNAWCLLSCVIALTSSASYAGGGYFVLGYGTHANQMAGTSTAVGFDGFAGSSNPGKLFAAGNRNDVGLKLFMPYRKIERTGSNDSIYDMESTSRNSIFYLPEAGMARRINDEWAWGLTLYGNGGLNTEYNDDNGIPSSNANPEACGDQAANFFLGCGKLGFDLSQVIVAPSLGWQVTPKHSVGITALLAYQRIKVYGLQAFQNFSAYPDAVTNNGYDSAFGFGMRIGWFGEITPWLDLGAAYSTKVYMQDFDKYKGLFADSGNFDIPSNYSIGAAIKPAPGWVIALDIQRVNWGEIKALGNGNLDSLQPGGSPLGSRGGSGFNWGSQNVYRLGLEYAASERLTLRGGYAYGRRPNNDEDINSVSFNMMAPNPVEQYTVGLSWKMDKKSEVHFAYGLFVEDKYRGPSATAGLGVGGRETVTPHVDVLFFGWSKKL
ncbi:MAG: outer membrane protein transport protein [Porticoccaceae bacterium]